MDACDGNVHGAFATALSKITPPVANASMAGEVGRAYP
jgi:hypothetical protein